MESDTIIYKTEFKFNYKKLLLAIGVIILFLGVWSGYTFYSNRDLGRLVLFSIPIFMGGLICMLAPFRYKIHVYSDRVHRMGLIERVIMLKDVKSVFVTEEQIQLKTAPFRTISITKDLRDKDDIIAFLLSHFEGRTGIKIWGDKHLIKKFTKPN